MWAPSLAQTQKKNGIILNTVAEVMYVVALHDLSLCIHYISFTK